VAGSGEKGFSDGPARACKFCYPHDVEFHAQEGVLLVADFDNNCIRRVFMDLGVGSVRALSCRCPVAALSLPCRCPVAALSLPCRCPVAALSLPCRCPVAALSLPCRCPVAALSLPCRCPVAALSLPCRCPVAALCARSVLPQSCVHPCASMCIHVHPCVCLAALSWSSVRVGATWCHVVWGHGVWGHGVPTSHVACCTNQEK
jgi:hypothetical protein